MLSVPSFRAMGTIWEKCLARLATAHRWVCQNTVPGVFKQDPESQQKIQQQLNPEFKGLFSLKFPGCHNFAPKIWTFKAAAALVESLEDSRSMDEIPAA